MLSFTFSDSVNLYTVSATHFVVLMWHMFYFIFIFKEMESI